MHPHSKVWFAKRTKLFEPKITSITPITRNPTCTCTQKFGSRSEPNFQSPNVNRLAVWSVNYFSSTPACTIAICTLLMLLFWKQGCSKDLFSWRGNGWDWNVGKQSIPPFQQCLQKLPSEYYTLMEEWPLRQEQTARKHSTSISVVSSKNYH